MKLLSAWILLASLAFAPKALAEATFDPGTLGHMKAVLDICGGVNRQEASQYLLQMKSMIGNASREDVQKAEKTQAYQIAYRSTRAELSGKAPRDLAAACSAYLSESN